jgi:hypothetical protein
MLAKEINRGRILMEGRDGMDADCATAQGIVAAGTATNGYASHCTSAESEPTNGDSANRNENADGNSPERKETDREAANSEKAARHPSKREPASSNVT